MIFLIEMRKKNGWRGSPQVIFTLSSSHLRAAAGREPSMPTTSSPTLCAARSTLGAIRVC